MKTKIKKSNTKTKGIELFDFAKSIDAQVSFCGTFSENETFCKANLETPEGTSLIDGWSVNGFNTSGDLDDALQLLALNISNKTITFSHQGTKYNVPKLKHTKGYRPS